MPGNVLQQDPPGSVGKRTKGQGQTRKLTANFSQLIASGSTGPLSLNNTTSCRVLNSVGQGNADFQRNGNSIENVSIHLRFHARPIDAGGGVTKVYPSFLVRVFLVIDKQWNNFTATGWAAVPDLGKLVTYNSKSGPVAPGSVTTCLRNPAYKDRYTILRDWTWITDPYSQDAGNVRYQYGISSFVNSPVVEETISLGGFITEFTGTNGGTAGETGADISDNALLLITYATGGVSGYMLSGKTQLEFRSNATK